MGLHGGAWGAWGCMGAHGSCMGLHGGAWGRMKAHGGAWGCMGLRECLQGHISALNPTLLTSLSSKTSINPTHMQLDQQSLPGAGALMTAPSAADLSEALAVARSDLGAARADLEAERGAGALQEARLAQVTAQLVRGYLVPQAMPECLSHLCAGRVAAHINTCSCINN